MKKILRFIWRLIVLCIILALGLNFFTLTRLSFNKADESYAMECARTVRTQFATTLTPIPLQKDENGMYTGINVPAGTRVKILAVYMEGLFDKTAPQYYSIYQDLYIELPDGTRGYAKVPEACIGLKCRDSQGNETVITGLVEQDKGPKEPPYALKLKDTGGAYQFSDISFVHDSNSRDRAFPVFVYNEVAQSAKKSRLYNNSISMFLAGGDGYYSFPYIIDKYAIPGNVRMVLGVAGILFLLFYIPFRYFFWLSYLSLKPLYNKKLTNREARSKAQARHRVGWWAFFILSGSIFCPPVWLIYWMTANWKEELAGMMKLRCPECNRMGMDIRTSGFRRVLVGSHIENFNKTKDYKDGVYTSNLDENDRQYMENSGRNQTLEFKGRRRIYDFIASWTEHFKCPHCGYAADKKVAHKEHEDGEIIDGTVTRTVRPTN